MRYKLNTVLQAPDNVRDEIAEFLTSDEKIARLAKWVAFPDILEQVEPSESIIVNHFQILLSFCVDDIDSELGEHVSTLLTTELYATHNIVTCWPRAWKDPMGALEELLPGVEPRLGRGLEC